MSAVDEISNSNIDRNVNYHTDTFSIIYQIKCFFQFKFKIEEKES